jgi:hypothetical protein
VEYEHIDITWGEVEKDDLVECGTFSPGWSLVMPFRTSQGNPTESPFGYANRRPVAKTG